MNTKLSMAVALDGTMDVKVTFKGGQQNQVTYRGRLFAEERITPAQLGITTREREIVKLLADGKSNKEVAVVLSISVKTAETHRNNIMRKLEFRSMSQLVRFAIRHRLIEA